MTCPKLKIAVFKFIFIMGSRNEIRAEKEWEDMNYTYILKCSDETLYTGWTNDLEKRINAHNAGKGAKYTKNRRPVELAYYEEFATKEEAMSRNTQSSS